MSKPAVFKITFLIVLIIGLLFLLSFLPPEIGAGDFRSYWSASYLLRMGQDFSSLANIDSIERTLTGWSGTYTVMAWFAPTGNLALLPYTLLPFTTALRAWLITNLVVISASVYWPWRDKKRLWIPFAAAFGFSMTMLSLVSGQINTLEVLGLALFLVLIQQQHDFMAGASLVLTTIKPHLVILTLPLLLLDLLRRRQWRALAGFSLTLAACGLVLFAFYPAWPASFRQLIDSGMSTLRETPSIAGLLVAAGQYTFRTWIWVLALAFTIIFWWRNGKNWRLEPLIDVSIIAGLMVAPIGWSYDQIMLLFPVMRLMQWAVDGSLHKTQSAVILVVLMIANLVSWVERILAPSEVWFFWIPWVVAVVYAFAWLSRKKHRALEIKTVPA